MSDFTLNVEGGSEEAVPSAIDRVAEGAAEAPETELIGAWRSPEGEETIVMSGPSEAAVTDIVQRSGLSVSSVSLISTEISRRDYTELFPGRQVYCAVHGDYHEPPACGL
jgi:hypothetical protein